MYSQADKRVETEIDGPRDNERMRRREKERDREGARGRERHRTSEREWI